MDELMCVYVFVWMYGASVGRVCVQHNVYAMCVYVSKISLRKVFDLTKQN